MDAESICEKIIKKKLTDMLGRTLAEALYQKAQFATSRARNDQEKLEIFVDTTCADPIFIGMWGTAQASIQKKEWLSLHETVSDPRLR